MLTSSLARYASAQLLMQYAHHIGDASFAQGSSRLNLTIDGRYRVQLRVVDALRVMIRARLDSLPAQGPARDLALQRMGQIACVSMERSTAACVIDDDEEAFWLRQLSEPRSIEDIDTLVGDFINELVFWVGSLD